MTMTSEDGYRSETLDREPTPADFGPEVEAEALESRRAAMLSTVGLASIDELAEYKDASLVHLRACVASIISLDPRDEEAVWLWKAIAGEQDRREDERSQWND